MSFLHNFSASYAENRTDVVTQRASEDVAPATRDKDSPRATAAIVVATSSVHNIHLHNVNPLVHMLLKFRPLCRAICHLHSHSRTRSADLRTLYISTLNRRCHSIVPLRAAPPRECTSHRNRRRHIADKS